MNTIIAFILMFGLLVFVHEFGHFLFAKKAGMLVREFAIGFGPKIFSIKKSETLYTIRLLPMGGYVRVAGEDPEIIDLKPGQHIGLTFNEHNQVKQIIINHKDKHPNAEVIEVEGSDLDHKLYIKGTLLGESDPQTFKVSETADYVMNEVETQIAPFNRQFQAKSKSKRAMQLFAGPLMNFILTVVLFFILGAFGGIPVEEAKIGDVQPGSPAETAGFEAGDEIVEIDGHPIQEWSDFQSIVREHPNQELTMIVLRNGSSESINVVPASQEIEDMTIGQIGVMQYLESSLTRAVPYSFEQTYEWSKMILVNLGMLVTGQFSVDMLSGPVGIYDATDQIVQTGFWNFIQWTAALSVNLGIINLLPLPALDGGRLLFVGIEAVRGKPLSTEKEGLVHFIGFALLMLLMLIVTWNDIQRLFL
ncbi:regulator of sigma E protease [Pelagirhabdus alkalitolerans]|uniref:Zinc metalloprotease n=1 Tax=Pelagirhabdus alkalitolerans TaxID=1612202 RepID=A0A1G6H6B8_9BACI|nr:RIP metalloprotease RseP [Pelagirhabdus alkalitolerans]SDB88996.1 regulator of sigma E protease [Pelagirhabdus alkalitolerans]